VRSWSCYQRLRTAFATTSLHEGKKIAPQVLESFHTRPIPEIARLGRTLRTWRSQPLAHFTTGRANNGGTEAINGIIELHRRIARGFRPRQLPTPHDPRRRTPHPPESPMTPFTQPRLLEEQLAQASPDLLRELLPADLHNGRDVASSSVPH
jgi:Transposase